MTTKILDVSGWWKNAHRRLIVWSGVSESTIERARYALKQLEDDGVAYTLELWPTTNKPDNSTKP